MADDTKKTNAPAPAPVKVDPVQAKVSLAAELAAEIALSPDEALGWYLNGLRQQAQYVAGNGGFRPDSRASATRVNAIVDAYWKVATE